jgi:hypothetical protein
MNNYQIDRDRWAQFDIFDQMGNIGSEVGRTIKAWRNNDQVRFTGALKRALDLFEATIDVLNSQHSGRIREVLVAREQFLNLFFGQAPSGDEQKIEKYFMEFAVASRKRQFA